MRRESSQIIINELNRAQIAGKKKLNQNYRNKLKQRTAAAIEICNILLQPKYLK